MDVYGLEGLRLRFKGHARECCVVDVAFGRLMTAGRDGIVNFSRLDGRGQTKSHRNEFRHGYAAQDTDFDALDGRLVYCSDGCFLEDGGALVGDEAGRITYFGRREEDEESVRGDKVRFSKSEWQQEQYFSTDYNPVYFDSSGLPVDEVSRMPVWRAPQGNLTNHLMVELKGTEEIEVKR